MYSKIDFSKELTVEINKDFNIKRIASWAHDKYLDHAAHIDSETYDAMMSVLAMTEGEEFELTKDQLLKLAADLLKY